MFTLVVCLTAGVSELCDKLLSRHCNFHRTTNDWNEQEWFTKCLSCVGSIHHLKLHEAKCGIDSTANFCRSKPLRTHVAGPTLHWGEPPTHAPAKLVAVQGPTAPPTAADESPSSKKLLAAIRAAFTAAHAILTSGGNQQQAVTAATDAAALMGARQNAHKVAEMAVRQLLTKVPTPVPATPSPTKSPTTKLMIGEIGEKWSKEFPEKQSTIVKVETTEKEQCHGLLGQMLGDIQHWGVCKKVKTIGDCIFCLHQHDLHSLLQLYCQASDLLSFCGSH